MEWMAQHWSQLTMAVGALYTLASVIVGMTPTPKDDAALRRIFAFVSFIVPKDAAGSVKAPLSKGGAS